MTDRHAGYIVTLSQDTREDDAEALLNAMRMVKGVANVHPLVADPSLHMAEVRVTTEIRQKLYEFIQEL